MFLPDLVSNSVSEENMRFLRKHMPPSNPPYVFSHMDVGTTNLIVADGQLRGIIDFKFAAYLPAWVEYVNSFAACCPQDEDFRDALGEKMESFDSAYEWWQLWWLIQMKPVEGYAESVAELRSRVESSLAS